MLRRALLCLSAAATLGVAAAQPVVPELIDAAGRGDVPALRRLLDTGAAVNQRDGRGRNAVLAATQGGYEAAARLLIERGADVNAQNEISDSAFLLAGARGHTGIVRAALAATPPPDFKRLNRYGGTALIPACHYGHAGAPRRPEPIRRPGREPADSRRTARPARDRAAAARGRRALKANQPLAGASRPLHISRSVPLLFAHSASTRGCSRFIAAA